MQYVITTERKGIWIKIAIGKKVKERKMKEQKKTDDGDDDELVLRLLTSKNK